MDHSRLQAFKSSLTIPPFKKSQLDLSSSESHKVPVRKRNFFIPNLSPIKPPNDSMQQLNSTANDIDLERFNERMDSLVVEEDDNLLNETNINNRRLTVCTILEDLGLKQYEELMKEMDLLSFLTLTDNDLKALGVTNPHHRETLNGAMKMFCEV